MERKKRQVKEDHAWTVVSADEEGYPIELTIGILCKVLQHEAE
jgi:hypothetical protein